MSRAASGAAGPFIIAPRLILIGAGALALPAAAIHLLDELHRGEVDRVYALIAGLAGLGFLASLGLAWRRSKPALVALGGLAFITFGLQASTHFVAGTVALSDLTHKEGIGFALDLLVLLPACAIVFVMAIVCWGNELRARKDTRGLALFLLSLLGAALYLAHAANDILWKGFGTLSVEDGCLVAVVTAVTWLLASLWIAAAPRRGGILMLASTTNVWYPFVTLHLVRGGISLGMIATRNGLGWAIAAGGMALAAVAASLAALAWMVLRARPARP